MISWGTKVPDVESGTPSRLYSIVPEAQVVPILFWSLLDIVIQVTIYNTTIQ